MLKSLIPVTLLSCFCASVHAEVVLDGSLGAGGALEGPQYGIEAEFGRQHGGNLFHSFSDFNINSEERVTFSGPENVDNIISRVTGGNASSIDGIVESTIPEASLYLLNPAGVMFGPNAVLNIGGSFHVSTADYLRMGENDRFYASPAEGENLSVAAPAAFGFMGDTVAPLSIEGSLLAVPAGKTFSMIGGGIAVRGDAHVQASSGRLNMAGVTGEGEVTPLETDLALSAPPGDVTVAGSSILNTSGEGGGDIYIRAGRFTLDDGLLASATLGAKNGGVIDVRAGELIASNGGRFAVNVVGTAVGQGSDIAIDVAGSVQFSGQNGNDQDSGMEATTFLGDAGAISLTAESLDLRNGAALSSSSYGSGRGGDITVRVRDSIRVAGTDKKGKVGGIISNARGTTADAGRGGTITLEARELTLADGVQIHSITRGSGQAGVIDINVAEKLTLAGGEAEKGMTAAIATVSAGSGNGGEIKIAAAKLNLEAGTNINSSALSSGNSGTIKIQATDSVNLSGENSHGRGSRINSTARSQAPSAGNGGVIELQARELNLAGGAKIATASFGPGEGGVISIKATEKINSSGMNSNGSPSGIFSTAQGANVGAGNGGVIEMETAELNLTDSGQVTAATNGPGRGGTIRINASETVFASGKAEGGNFSGVYSSSANPAPGTGDAGVIGLKTKQLFLADGARVSAATNGPGFGGNVDVQAQHIRLLDAGIITAESTGEGDAGRVILRVGDTLRMVNSFVKTATTRADGGDIDVSAPGYLFLSNSAITTSVAAENGDGGNIAFTPEFVVLNNSQIIAKAVGGDGGNIDITTTGIYNFSRGPLGDYINASSQFGVDGVVAVNSPDVNVSETLVVLPANYIDAAKWIKDTCTAQAMRSSSFVTAERDGVPNPQSDLTPSGPLLTQSVKARQTAGAEPAVPKRDQQALAVLTACNKKAEGI
ncbi:MAG: filamentous hemagglutinin N-terminal domain-containing protein [Gammaproteobacteria bacterium]|nr:filamentous hemagglutinin N-terminal domain-containing protein [Gammaproteobacteria bacterium]